MRGSIDQCRGPEGVISTQTSYQATLTTTSVGRTISARVYLVRNPSGGVPIEMVALPITITFSGSGGVSSLRIGGRLITGSHTVFSLRVLEIISGGISQRSVSVTSARERSTTEVSPSLRGR